MIGVTLEPLSDNWRTLASVEAKIGAELGIDARATAKQAGPLRLDIEMLILARRYGSAMKSGTVGEALRAGVKLVSTVKLGASVSPDAEGNRRVAPEALEVADPSETVADASLVDAIQSLILDVLTAAGARSPPRCSHFYGASRRDAPCLGPSQDWSQYSTRPRNSSPLTPMPRVRSCLQTELVSRPASSKRSHAGAIIAT